jgi:hypothetical protein
MVYVCMAMHSDASGIEDAVVVTALEEKSVVISNVL